MKEYKGFNKDMTCRGFQYEEGKEYECEGKVKVCENGFHACERPLDCFEYYNPAESVYHEVELDGDISESTDDTKVAASKIKVGARLNVLGLVKAQFDYVKSKTTHENTDSKVANAGDCGAANAGDCGAANAGYRGAAISRGTASVGKHGVAIARGSNSNNCKVKGDLGAVLIIVQEQEENYDIKNWKAVVVDGTNIKPDTWYKLENGIFVEVEKEKKPAEAGRMSNEKYNLFRRSFRVI